MSIQSWFLSLNGQQTLNLTRVFQKFASSKGIKIYVTQDYKDFEGEIVDKTYMNPSSRIELAAARKLFFMEDKNLSYSSNKKNEPNGGISIEHMDYTIRIAVDGCRTNAENVFVAMLLMSFLTDMNLENISIILGSKFDLKNYQNEFSFYKKKITI